MYGRKIYGLCLSDQLLETAAFRRETRFAAPDKAAVHLIFIYLFISLNPPKLGKYMYNIYEQYQHNMITATTQSIHYNIRKSIKTTVLCCFGLFNCVPSVPRVTVILCWKGRIVMCDSALRLTRSKQMSLTCRMYSCSLCVNKLSIYLFISSRLNRGLRLPAMGQSRGSSAGQLHGECGTSSALVRRKWVEPRLAALMGPVYIRDRSFKG